MVINALNSGANVFMADFEDSDARRLGSNVIEGQMNLRDAMRARSSSKSPKANIYKLNDEFAVLFCPSARLAPAGEACSRSMAHPISASLFDFGLYFFHNAACCRSRHRSLFLFAKDGKPSGSALVERCLHLRAGIFRDSPGTIRATVLIETILAAFEMDEILYELKDHSAGSELRALGLHLQLYQEIQLSPEDQTLPDRAQVTMTSISSHRMSNC